MSITTIELCQKYQQWKKEYIEPQLEDFGYDESICENYEQVTDNLIQIIINEETHAPHPDFEDSKKLFISLLNDNIRVFKEEKKEAYEPEHDDLDD